MRSLKRNQIKDRYKIGNSSFTRDRVLTFKDTSLLILHNSKRDMQTNIDKYVDYFKSDIDTLSKSAYSKARAKISPSLFVKLNDDLIDEYYRDNEDIKLYKGFRVFAIDGSVIELPNVEPIVKKSSKDNSEYVMSSSIREIYGYSSNDKGEYETKARVSILYDVENSIIFDSILNSYFSSEKDMAYEHIEYLANLKSKSSNKYKDLIIFDRGYPSFGLLIYLIENGIDYIIRVSKSRFKEIESFRNSRDKKDEIIKLKLSKNRLQDIKRKNRNHKIDSVIKSKEIGDEIILRAIKIYLEDSNEDEILITSLIDQDRFKYEIFKEFYFKRWRVEEEYKVIKSLMQIENFTGITQIAIYQDFYATIFMSNITNVILADIEIDKNRKKSVNNRYSYKINKNYSIGLIKDKFLYLVAMDENLEEFFKKVEKKIKRNLTIVKPNRKFKRVRKTKHKYPINKKGPI